MNNSPPIRVMLVDDHAVVHSGIGAFLFVSDDLKLVAEAADGEEAVRLCESVPIDVVLMDLVMPRMDGVTATRKIREQYPHIQVIILTSFKESTLVQDALKAGAIGYLLKNVTSDKLAQAIRAAYRGDSTLGPEAVKALMEVIRHQDDVLLGEDLTPREHEVLGLMVKGLNNKKIAEILFVTPATVKFHVSNILSKLGAASRTAAVVLARELNLVPTQDQAGSKA